MIINQMVSCRIDGRVPESSVEDLKQHYLKDEDQDQLPEDRAENCPTHELSRGHLLGQSVVRLCRPDHNGCRDDENDVLVEKLRVRESGVKEVQNSSILELNHCVHLHEFK